MFTNKFDEMLEDVSQLSGCGWDEESKITLMARFLEESGADLIAFRTFLEKQAKEESGVDFTDIEIRSKDELVRVVLEYLGEGNSGDYDPTDPNDTPLVRFTVARLYQKGEEIKPYYTDLASEHGEPIIAPETGYLDITDASYCTQLPTTLSPDMLIQAGKLILQAVASNVKSQFSIKRVCAALSWLEPKNLQGASCDVTPVESK